MSLIKPGEDPFFSKINLLFIFSISVLVVFPALMAHLFFFQPMLETQSQQKAALEELKIAKLEAYKAEMKKNKVENGIHMATGLIADKNYQLVIQQCTSCHSPKLITQTQATRERWEGLIRWMQANHKLWDLGENEAPILDYLAKNYPPQQKGRRPALTEVIWYELNP